MFCPRILRISHYIFFSISFHFLSHSTGYCFTFSNYSPAEPILKEEEVTKKRYIEVKSKDILTSHFAPIMAGGEKEHFSILEALKRLFWHFWQLSLHFAAWECFYQKDGEKQKRMLFILNLNRVASVSCPLPASGHLNNICSYCKVNSAIMSVFLSLQYFYLQNFTTSDSYMC